MHKYSIHQNIQYLSKVLISACLIIQMQISEAKKQLHLLALKCDFCHLEFPTYRITMIDEGKKIHFRHKISDKLEKSEQIPKHYISRSPPKSPRIRQCSPPPIRSIKSDNLYSAKQTSTEQKNRISRICLNCLQNNSKDKIPKASKETYYDMALRLIQKVPIPHYQYANECIKMADELQEELEKKIKQIIKKIEEAKFTVYRSCMQIKRYCQNYIDKVKHFESFNIEGWRQCWKENKLKKRFFQNISLNQNEALHHIFGRIHLLKQLQQKIQQFKFDMPDLSEFIRQNDSLTKVKLSICNVPISAITNINGRNFYGIADGRIIYEALNGLVTNSDHQSLIRSFAYDGQYTLYSGSDDFTIKAWDLHEDKIRCIQTFGKLEENKSYHRNIGIIRKGEALVTTRGQFDEFRIRIWDLGKDYANIGEMSGHQSFIKDMITLKNDQVITVSEDKSVKIWDTRKNTEIACLHNLFKMTAVAINERLGFCAVADQENKIKILDINNNLNVLNCWKIPRKISILKTTNNCFSYLIVVTLNSISIWDWLGEKLHQSDIEINFVPSCLTHIGDKLILADGSGNIIKLVVPLLKEISDRSNQGIKNNLN